VHGAKEIALELRQPIYRIFFVQSLKRKEVMIRRQALYKEKNYFVAQSLVELNE